MSQSLGSKPPSLMKMEASPVPQDAHWKFDEEVDRLGPCPGVQQKGTQNNTGITVPPSGDLPALLLVSSRLGARSAMSRTHQESLILSVNMAACHCRNKQFCLLIEYKLFHHLQ